MTKKILAWLKHEFLEMLPPTLYFFVVFHVVAFSSALMNHQYGISVATSATATIGAVLAGKSILIANALPFMHWFMNIRLIYNVLWRILFYILIIIVVQSLEAYIPMISKYDGFRAALIHFFEEINWYHFWGLHIALVGFLMIYSLATSLIAEFGRNTMKQVFFGLRQKSTLQE